MLDQLTEVETIFPIPSLSWAALTGQAAAIHGHSRFELLLEKSVNTILAASSPA